MGFQLIISFIEVFTILLKSKRPKPVRRHTYAEFVDYVISCKADFFALTETWLGKNGDAHRAEITPTGFKLIDLLRNDRRGGGTALLFRENLNVQKIAAKELHLNIWSSKLKFALSSFTAHPIRLHTLSPQALFSLTLRTIWRRP